MLACMIMATIVHTWQCGQRGVQMKLLPAVQETCDLFRKLCWQEQIILHDTLYIFWSEEIHYYFPLSGHAMVPCDNDFRYRSCHKNWLTGKAHAVQMKVICFLWLVGNRESFRRVYDRFWMSKSSLHLCISNVSDALHSRYYFRRT